MEYYRLFPYESVDFLEDTERELLPIESHVRCIVDE